MLLALYTSHSYPAQLVLRWVTFHWCTVSVCNQPPRPTQPPTLSGMRNEYRSKSGVALRRYIKEGWLVWISVWVAGKNMIYLSTLDTGIVYEAVYRSPTFTSFMYVLSNLQAGTKRVNHSGFYGIKRVNHSGFYWSKR